MTEAKKDKETRHIEEKTTQLYRSETNRVIAGVAGGLGDFFNIDHTVIRILFVLLTIFGGSGVVIYGVLWLIVPTKSQISKNSQEAIKANIDEMKEKTESLAHSIGRAGDRKENSKFWWALIIIVVGFFFLLNNFGLLEPLELDKLWPLILIIFGLAIILRKS